MSFRNYYDTTSSYRSRDIGRSTSGLSAERPTTVTAKYTNTPSFKSSSIPVLNDRSSREETPISSIANRYANYGKTSIEKATPKFEKKDYSKLAVPMVSTNRSRDVSPVSTSSKYSISRSSRLASPDRKAPKTTKEKNTDSKADRDKDIPNKTDKASGYTGLSSYKLYPRTTSYTRSIPRTEVKPEITVNRYAIANRLSSPNYLRSPTPVKRSSVSPINNTDNSKNEPQKPTISINILEESEVLENEVENKNTEYNSAKTTEEQNNEETITVVTRHTSPTPPGSSVYVRMRRADMAKTVEKKVTRTKNKPEMVDKEIQSDRLDDTTRSSRFGGTNRTAVTNWTYYSPNYNNYTGYAGRYSTQYSNLRDSPSSNSNNERSSRSRSKEPISVENSSPLTYSDSDKNREQIFSNSTVSKEEIINIYDQNKDDDSSEIIINVNLKLKKARSPVSSKELISPEITITNSHQLPPQPPKSESSSSKIKKIKVRKSSTDSSSDSSSSKKVGKKRSKSTSSTDSDQSKIKDSSKIPSKIISKTTSSSSVPATSSKTKHSKSKERNNSPESSITISTQSSVSEDETTSKSKVDNSRTSADETSLPTDLSGKQSSPFVPKNENGTEEAKSFLIRALAPVTNLFKLRHQESSDGTRWLENSNSSESTSKDVANLITESGSSKSKNNTSNIIASNEDNLVKLKGIRHIESGERAWWMESDSSKKVSSTDQQRTQNESYNENKNEKSSNNTSLTDTKNLGKPLKPKAYAEEEKPWWLDSSANIPDGIERLTPPRKSSSDSDKSEKFNFFKIRHIESGDQKDWWLTSNENSSNSNKIETHSNISLSKSGSDQRSFPLRRIRHVESGERPWWLSSEKNIPEGIEKLPTPPNESDSSDSEEIQEYVPSTQIPPFPLNLPDDEPLGDRRSPEGVETPKDSEDYGRGRKSPYENNAFRSNSCHLYRKGAEKFISRYTDIDDILGTSSQIYSPFMDSIYAQRTGQLLDDDDECEEIDPTQVIIHDSTAQTPVIKKLRCRSEIVDYHEGDQALIDDHLAFVRKWNETVANANL